MTTKKTGKRKPIMVSEELHKKIKILAAERGEGMADVIEGMISSAK